MKYFILCACLLLSIFSYSQNVLDSSVNFVYQGEWFNPMLVVARIPNSKDTILLKNLKAGTYKINTSNGKAYFTIDQNGLIDGNSYLVNKNYSDLDSISNESNSSKLIKFEKFINGKLSLSFVYTTNLRTIKEYGADESLIKIRYDTLIHGEPKSSIIYYQKNGLKTDVHDGVKNMDTAFYPDGMIYKIESSQYKFKKVYNYFGRLDQHEYVKYINEKKGLYEKYEDFYRGNEIYKRIITHAGNNRVTTLKLDAGVIISKEVFSTIKKRNVDKSTRIVYDKAGVITSKEIISTIKKGDVYESTKTVYNKDGKIIFQNKTSEPVSNPISTEIDYSH